MPRFVKVDRVGRRDFECPLSNCHDPGTNCALVFWAICTFHSSLFLEMPILSPRRIKNAVFLGVFTGTFSKSGKYAAGTFQFECENWTLLQSSVCFSRELRVDWVLGLSHVHVSGGCVGLCMVLFSDVVFWLWTNKKGPAGRSFVERKKGMQAPSDTWSFRLVLVPGSLEFLDPAGFSLPEFGVSDGSN